MPTGVEDHLMEWRPITGLQPECPRHLPGRSTSRHPRSAALTAVTVAVLAKHSRLIQFLGCTVFCELPEAAYY